MALWLTSCTSLQGKNSAPKIKPPDPYNKDGQLVYTYDAEKDAVIVPFWYWEKLFDYIVDTQTMQEIYNYK